MDKSTVMNELLDKQVSKEAIALISKLLPKGEDLPIQALDAIKGHAFDHSKNSVLDALGLKPEFIGKTLEYYLSKSFTPDDSDKRSTVSGAVEKFLDILDDNYELKIFFTMCGVEKLNEYVSENPVLALRKTFDSGEFSPEKLLEALTGILSNPSKKSNLYDIDSSIY